MLSSCKRWTFILKLLFLNKILSYFSLRCFFCNCIFIYFLFFFIFCAFRILISEEKHLKNVNFLRLILLNKENYNFTHTSKLITLNMSSFHLHVCLFRTTFISVCNITSDINSADGRFFLFILEGNAIWDGTRNSREEAWSSAQSICSGGITRRPGAKRSRVLEPAVDGHETRRIETGKRRNRRFIWKYYDGVVASVLPLQGGRRFWYVPSVV